eukprot:CAMPEP_0171064436 /NCGR_PEP_ID=MMETSP0766_2-20121228/6287_1 /TAXON_ID=439317 /ORGANISM="Gambierdiscus australes, Strain CAWD 149" /LENGTH=55 /DNA_ID=CAMNT_0011520469 /DNA_START=124 /DNA_END=288 /DNA_ORIENTATION=-
METLISGRRFDKAHIASWQGSSFCPARPAQTNASHLRKQRPTRKSSTTITRHDFS